MWEPVPLPEEPPPPRRRRKIVIVTAGSVPRLLLFAIAVLMFAFFFLTRTDRGATLVVEQVLQRLPIKGEITAEGSRSDRLLEGVYLYDVAIRGEDGRLFLEADSVRLRYNWRTLL